MTISKLNAFLSNADQCYRTYKSQRYKRDFFNTHWLHEDFTLSQKSRLEYWLDRWCVTRFLHRKFCHLDLGATYKTLSQLQTDSLTKEQQKQVKRACKMLACFGRAKLGWGEDKLGRLDEIIRACRIPNHDPDVENIFQDLWKSDDFPDQD